jgi:hypothetical protein
MKSVMQLIGIILCLHAISGCSDHTQTARFAFNNPGGMWMPGQLAQQAQTLRSLGVENPQNLADPLGHPLGAIVWLGGCSASFVSPEGLIATNHHCANGTLQFHSTPGHNLFKDGFLARDQHEELPGEIGKKVWVTREIIDVTDVIRSGIDAIADPLERYTEIESRIKALVAQEEQPDKGIRCEIRKYYEGQKYYLLKFLELKDVRLVYAPPESIGAYGGDIDNWHWPRHTGDFTFYRAYVSPFGQSAEYAPDNVPYRPKYWLTVASEPLREHDFVMVAGYPGRTQRWKMLDEFLFTVQQDNPMRIGILRDIAELYNRLADQNEDIRIKVTPNIKGVMNHLLLLELIQENVEQVDLVDQKMRQQAEFEAWIAGDVQRQKKWGCVLHEIALLNTEHHENAERDYLLSCIINHVKMLDSAHTIVRMAEERPKTDDRREPDLQQRNWDRIVQSLERLQKSYDPIIDKAVLCFYLERICKLPVDQKESLCKAFTETDLDTQEQIHSYVDSLFTESLILDDSRQRVELFNQASTETLCQSPDPFIQLALRLRPFTKEQEQNSKIYEGKMSLLRPLYVQARQAFGKEPLAPDANGTLRVSYGTVKGYSPKPDAPVYKPFTTLSQVVQKHTGAEPFNAPAALLEAAAEVSSNTAFYDKYIEDIPVNFLSDLDITGGNSGSATLNHKGEWVGLVFDGNSEAVASDLLFLPDITRAIHVDIRYVLWIMKYIDHADNLLRELGINKPL